MSALPSYCLHVYHHAVYIYFTTMLFTSTLPPYCLHLYNYAVYVYNQTVYNYFITKLSASIFPPDCFQSSPHPPPPPPTPPPLLCVCSVSLVFFIVFFLGGGGVVRVQFLCFTFVECRRSVPAFCYQDKLLHLFVWWFAERCGLNAMSLARRTSLLRKSSWH